MQVKIKKFDVDMEVKSKGIEFEVHQPKGVAQLGDCYITMTNLTWCKGKIAKRGGVDISWKDFAEILKSEESKKAAIKAVKSLK